ncbi:MAG: transposase [Lentisphaeraceae bacterium]|nr:transposase [Lentisphaeraceae bacterium]
MPHYDTVYKYQMITYRLGDSLPHHKFIPGNTGVPSVNSIDESRNPRNTGVPPVNSIDESRNPGNTGVPPVLSENSTPKYEQALQRRKAIEKDLDKGYGSCILKIPEIAKLVVDAWKYFDGERYDLIAYVVMPNHVHILIKTFEDYSMSKIVHSWKSYTAHEIKKFFSAGGRSEGVGVEKTGETPVFPGCIEKTGETPVFPGCIEKTGEMPVFPGCIEGAGGTPMLLEGKVWQIEYWDRFIRNEKHFAQAVNYIHENPVKAGLCHHPKEWRWSSAEDL